MKEGDVVKVINTRSALYGTEGLIEMVNGELYVVQLRGHHKLEDFLENELKLID